MSSTGRGGVRVRDDFYQTPPWVLEWYEPYLLSDRPVHDTKTILEPGAGTGNLVQELRRIYPDAKIVAVEIRPECEPMLRERGADEVIVGDFLDPVVQGMVRHHGSYDLVLGNPPYGGNKRSTHYEIWLRFVKSGIVLLEALAPSPHQFHRPGLHFLLRMGALEGWEDHRHGWMHNHVPDVTLLPKRPQFVKGGSDSATYAWMRWYRDERTTGSFKIMEHCGKIDRRTGRTVR